MKLRIGISAIILAAALIFTHSLTALACFLAAFIHEIGHIFAAHLFSVKFREMKLTPFGATLIPRTDMGSFFSEIVICASGPAINFLCAVFSVLIFKSIGEFLKLFIASSLFLGILNMLPISDFDGGRILFTIIESKGSFLWARNVLNLTSFTLIFALWSISLYFLLRATASISLFVFSCSLFIKLFVSKKDKY